MTTVKFDTILGKLREQDSTSAIGGHTVQTTGPADNDIIRYHASSGSWSFEQLSGAGEVNTSSNLGTGSQWFKSKVGVDLQFRTVTADGSGLIWTTNTNDLKLSFGSHIVLLGSVTAGSFVGSSSNYIPQGVLPVGSIPSLTTYLPQGQLPVGSLAVVLPQGVLPVGSIPNLTAYLPQGVLPNGSLPTTITSTGSHVSVYGSFSGSFIGGYGSFNNNLVALNLSGTNTGDQTLAGLNGLPQGVLPVGSIPNLTAYIPQGQLITGSLPNTITISGSTVAPYGSYSSKVVAGSFIGDGSGLTSLPLSGYLPQGVLPSGSLVNSLPQGQVPVGSLNAVLPQGVLPNGSLPTTITLSGSLVSAYGSFSGSLIGGYGSFNANIFALNLSGTNTGDQTLAGLNGLPQGVLPAGSLVNALPQGVIPIGSLTNALPQGVLPIGSIPQASIVTVGNITTGTWGIANLNAGSINAGTLTDSRLPSSMAGKTFTTDILGSGGIVNGSFTGSLAANNFVGPGTGLTGVVKTVVGTSNRISVAANGSVVDIDANYAGQSTITTLGTITTGTWNTALNAGSLTAGTVADARLPSSQAGKTFTTDVSGTDISLTGSIVATNTINWQTVSGSTTISTGTGYITGSTARTVFTLPATMVVGGAFAITGSETGGWVIKQLANQTINFGAVTTTAGTGGTITSTNRRDSIQLICTRNGSEWNVTNSVGNMTVV